MTRVMRRILLLRHAKSDWSDPAASDHARPLNRRGLVAAEIPAAPPPHHDERLYNAAAGSILDVLGQASPSIKSLLLVGHNPGLQELSTLLIASGDLDDRERLHEKLPAGGLVVIDFPIEDWSKLHPRSG